MSQHYTGPAMLHLDDNELYVVYVHLLHVNEPIARSIRERIYLHLNSYEKRGTTDGTHGSTKTQDEGTT